jgi:hypothetical protein
MNVARVVSWNIFLLLISALCVTTLTTGAAESTPVLQPSFPDYAAMPLPAVAPRDGPGAAVDVGPPFSWDQTAVVRAGETFAIILQGFDPGFQPIFINMNPLSGVVNIESFNAQTGVLSFTVPPNTLPQIVSIPFQVTARGITSLATYNFNIDIRDKNFKLRGTSFVAESPGQFIQPGQMVRYEWTQTGRGEKRPKSEARITGQTGPATGLLSTSITEIDTVKFRPVVLGHYLMLVTPRDVLGEPPRGTNSIGRVFRCTFGTDNLAPVTDGISADTFLPDVGQTITVQPNAVDPETAQSVFSNEIYDFGDGTIQTGITGAATHAYAQPGIYAVRCTVADTQGASAVAQDNVIVGATVVPQLAFSFNKKIIPFEAGVGDEKADTLNVAFKGIAAKTGDRIVFTFNRNRFGRTSASDASDDTDIILKGNSFTGMTRQAKNFTVVAGSGGISIKIMAAQFDRTGDPRLGRADLKGIFKNQRIAVCVIPADGSVPRVQVYTGNIQVKVKGGAVDSLVYIPEESVNGKATTKLPNPKTQELP